LEVRARAAPAGGGATAEASGRARCRAQKGQDEPKAAKPKCISIRDAIEHHDRAGAMCGIAGYRSERAQPPGVLRAMTAALLHRGPDSAGCYRSGPFAGGMRRLSIVDPEGGDQPLFSQDGSVALIYNGEIYNAPALRRELEAKGYRFRTGSDGEVICHLYQDCGEALFARLDGMFAAALWIERENKLLLARDVAGEKPLYYAAGPGGALAFASEIKSLKAFPGLDLDLDPQALWDFPTFLWVPEPDTVYRAVKALPPGHLLASNADGVRLRPFTQSAAPSPFEAGDEDVVAETRRVVTEAVRSRLLSDVPVGSLLSGGLDSSIVASVASRELGPIDTFSVGFEDLPDPYHGSSDESAEAGATARWIGSRHHAIRVSAQGMRRDLDRFCRHGDQPFAVSSGLGILAVARAAHEAGIKVLLSGDGADECFGGYSWYAHLEACGGANGVAPANGVKPANGVRVANGVSFHSLGLPLADRLQALAAYPPQQRAWAWHYYAAEADKTELFDPDAFANVESSLRHFHRYDPSARWRSEDFIRQDRRFYLPNEMLRKVDRMTMAYSVEGRAPFVAPSVLALAERLRYRHMVRDGSLKWALRRAFAGLLPEDVVNRPKHGFNVPIDHWLKHDWADLLDEAFAPGSALGRLGLIGREAGDRARRLLADPARPNGHMLFCFIMLNRWLEQERHAADR